MHPNGEKKHFSIVQTEPKDKTEVDLGVAVYSSVFAHGCFETVSSNLKH